MIGRPEVRYLSNCDSFSFNKLNLGWLIVWLVGWGVTALSDSISVYIEQGERKEDRIYDSKENQNNSHQAPPAVKPANSVLLSN